MKWMRAFLPAAILVALAVGWFAGRSSAPSVFGVATAASTAQEDPQRPRGWTPGKGWGWVWGATDEVGSLNAMTNEMRRAAFRLVKEGKVYDLGVPYNRNSFKWP